MKYSALQNQCISLDRLNDEYEFWHNDPDRTIEIMYELSDRRSHIQSCIMLLVINVFIRFNKGEC